MPLLFLPMKIPIIFFIILFNVVIVANCYSAMNSACTDDDYSATVLESKTDGTFIKNLVDLRSVFVLDNQGATVEYPYLGISGGAIFSNDQGKTCIITEPINVLYDFDLISTSIHSNPSSFPAFFLEAYQTRTDNCESSIDRCYGSPISTTVMSSCTPNAISPFWQFSGGSVKMHVTSTWTETFCLPDRACSSQLKCSGSVTSFSDAGDMHLPVSGRKTFNVTHAEAKRLIELVPAYSLYFSNPNGGLLGQPFRSSDIPYTTGLFKNFSTHSTFNAEGIAIDVRKPIEKLDELLQTKFPFNEMSKIIDWLELLAVSPSPPQFNLAIGEVSYLVVDLDKFDALAVFVRWMMGSYFLIVILHGLRSTFLGIEGNSQDV